MRALFGLLLVLVVYGQTEKRLTYDTEIGGFDYSWTNPDVSGTTSESMDSTGYSVQTDDDITTGVALSRPNSAGVWGTNDQGGTKGLVGEFYATNLKPGTGNAFYQVTQAEIVFNSDCMSSDTATATFVYVDDNGATQVNSYTVTGATEGTNGAYIRFSVDLPYGGVRVGNDKIGFSMQTNQYCEGDVNAQELVIMAIPIATEEPTEDPTSRPTTTAEPTMAPTGSCVGETAWGDPHIHTMASIKSAVQYNYQKQGWFYYLASCDLQDFENFPFFILSHHAYCWWNGDKACIDNNLLVLNTKPDPWTIYFEESSLTINVGSGTTDYDGSAIDLSQINGEQNAKEINYNDDVALPNQSGKLKIWMENGQIVLELSDVAYDAQPRMCNKNTLSGRDLECGSLKADGEVIQIRNSGTWTVYTCPRLLRGISCGLMGKFYRGDCTESQLKDSSDLCSEILVASDGSIKQDGRGRAWTDDVYGEMADSWRIDIVEDLLANSYGYTVNFAVGRDDDDEIYHHQKKGKKGKTFGFEGRSLNIDSSRLEGECANDPQRLKQVNETCQANTVLKYERCCKEIGFCDLLWAACIEDLCACAYADGVPDSFNEDICLQEIVHDSMNTTCSTPWFYPTATPTNAPTPSPTGLIAGLPTGTKAKDLIWLYLIFVVIFVIIAAAAYWYYRKKNNAGKAAFDDDIEAPQEATTGNTYE